MKEIKDLTVEDVKWMCEKADVFAGDFHDEWCSLTIDDTTVVFDQKKGWVNNPFVFTHLMDRAIEGVNRESLTNKSKKDFIEILVEAEGVSVQCSKSIGASMAFMFDEHENIDQAKLSALLYIKEQEERG